MFEKDDDYYKARKEDKDRITKVIKVWNGKEEAIHDGGFEKGAEYGYNKANEWHYVKDGLPKETKKYFIYSKEWGVEVRKFFADVGYFECRKNDNVIVWKEIVLPELKESE